MRCGIHWVLVFVETQGQNVENIFFPGYEASYVQYDLFGVSAINNNPFRSKKVKHTFANEYK